MIVSGLGVGKTALINTSLVHVMDIAPTLVELAKAGGPKINAPPFQGVSIAPIITGEAGSVRDEDQWLGWRTD